MTRGADRCLTCGDVAVEATVVAVDGPFADVAVADGRERVAVDLVEEVEPGDVLLCHAGVALQRLARP